MATSNSWKRDKKGLGIWEHRGKVAFAGWGMSPIDRRWDGESMDRTLGAFAILAAKRALDDAGLKPEDVDGLFQCPNNMAISGTGPSADWGPYRPYFDPPYDSEDGLTIVTPKWMLANFKELKNVTYAPTDVPDIGEGLGMAAQAVADGKCKVALYIYCANNLEGRYRRGGMLASAEGGNQWSNPWGANGIDLQGTSTMPFRQYLRKYGGTWEEVLGPIVVNEHRNGMMNNWGFYSTTNSARLSYKDYVDSRPITWPARIWDYDRPVNAAGAFIITTSERARDMKQPPVYILNHNEGGPGPRGRSSQITMEEWQDHNQWIAEVVYEGSGLKPSDVDIFNPYDGFSPMVPFSLEAFGWHGLKKGDTVEFVKGDIRVEGPHPLLSGGGNLGNGRTRTAMYIDGIEQLRGQAGPRQVTVKADTAVVSYGALLFAWYLCLSKHPN